jgi:hypothetical protein
MRKFEDAAAQKDDTNSSSAKIQLILLNLKFTNENPKN